jgi:hypothetical protein
MCDYSLHSVKTRSANIGDQLTTRQFGWSTKGFAASEDHNVAVCLLPGTELSFAEEARKERLWPWTKTVVRHKTAIFRKINQDRPAVHHDALEFPDGQIVLVTLLATGQRATVLQLPTSAVDLSGPQEAARSNSRALALAPSTTD